MRIKALALQDGEQELLCGAVEIITNHGLRIGRLGIDQHEGLTALTEAAIAYFKAHSDLFDLVNDEQA